MSFKDEWREVGLFYFIEITTTIAPSLIIGAAIYLVGIGFTYIEIGTIFLVNRLVVGISEIPTGIVADKYGRKFSTLVGLFIWGVAYTALPLQSSFFYLLTIFGLLGFGLTFISGALSAWFIDTLKEKGLEEWIHRCTSRKASINGLSRFSAYLVVIYFYYRFYTGGVLSDTIIGIMKLFYIAAGLILLFTFLIVWWEGKEVNVESNKTEEKRLLGYIRKTLKNSLEFMYQSRIILILAIEAIIFMFAFSVFQGGKKPFLTEILNQPVYVLSILTAVTSFIGFFINMKSEAFKEWVGDYPLTLLVLTIPVGVSIFIFSLTREPIFAFGLFILVTVFMVFRKPIKSVYFQKNIPSNIRATMGSFFSLINQIGGALGVLIIFGYIGDVYGLQTALMVGGVIISSISFIYLILKKK